MPIHTKKTTKKQQKNNKKTTKNNKKTTKNKKQPFLFFYITQKPADENQQPRYY
jgi:hypothetical protein